MVHFTCSQLEENICSIALSGNWLKPMDDWLTEHSIFQNAPVTIGATQKRGPGKRRQRNQAAEVTAEGSNDDSFTWWRGGKLSKVVLLKAVLSKPKIRKAAWQGNLVWLCFCPYGFNNSHMNIGCFVLVLLFDTYSRDILLDFPLEMMLICLFFIRWSEKIS